MPLRPYNKPATTYAQQLAKLQVRGMVVSDPVAAQHFLQHINYYRLTAYWLPFEIDHITQKFKAGTTFEDVLALYNFDRELRLLVLDAIERIEVSVRAQWAYHLGHTYGAHAHLDKSLAHNPIHWQKNTGDLAREVERADEIFIQHLKTTYAEELPPIWAVCEVMSMGLLSKWYKNLRHRSDQKAIAKVYGLSAVTLQSWLHHLSVVRNNCAHHSRLWNRDYARVSIMHRNKNPEFVTNDKLYNSFVSILHLMDVIAPNHHWREKMKVLLAANAKWLGDMGFPADWARRSVWR